MADVNITATTVEFVESPHMLENGWEFIGINSTQQGRVLLRKPGNWPLDKNTGKEKNMKPKKGNFDPPPTV